MESGKTPRMEELESGQQEMQEKIAKMMKMGKGITDDPDLQRNPTSWKDDIDPSIVPNPNDLCQQGELKKESSGQSTSTYIQGAVSWTRS